MNRFKVMSMPHNENEWAQHVVVDGNHPTSHEWANFVCICSDRDIAEAVATALELRPPVWQKL